MRCEAVCLLNDGYRKTLCYSGLSAMLTKIYIILTVLKCHLFRKDFPKYSVGNIPCPGGRNSLPILSLLYFCPENCLTTWACVCRQVFVCLPTGPSALRVQGPLPRTPQMFNVLDEWIDGWKDGWGRDITGTRWTASGMWISSFCSVLNPHYVPVPLLGAGV